MSWLFSHPVFPNGRTPTITWAMDMVPAYHYRLIRPKLVLFVLQNTCMQAPGMGAFADNRLGLGISTWTSSSQ